MSRLKPISALLIGLGALLTGCLQPSGPLTGTWRSHTAELTLTEQGGSIQFGCATGSISRAVLVNAQGEFSANGTYTQGSGVAPPPNFPPPTPQPTVYSGKLSGNTLSFSAQIQSGSSLGPITVVRDSSDQVFLCA